jgi:hypothetical protein
MNIDSRPDGITLSSPTAFASARVETPKSLQDGVEGDRQQRAVIASDDYFFFGSP